MVVTFLPYLWVHENVVSFPGDMLKETLDADYHIEELLLQAEHSGFPVERKRKYTIGRLRVKLKSSGCYKHIFFKVEVEGLLVCSIDEDVV